MSERQSAEITPHRPVVPEHEIDDLRERLSRARLPEPETAPGWAQGIPLDYLTELIRHWRDEYDWRRVECELASRGQSRTVVDGLGIHFLHVRSPRPDARPLLITHGWPGSVVEALDVIDASPPSTSSSRPCPGSATPRSPPRRDGASSASPTPGSR
jgi:hypothetical protein